MKSVFDKKMMCCGCTACYSACPKDAIIMCLDEEGFLYPKINEEKCVDCGICRKVCDFQKTEATSAGFMQKAYGFFHNDSEVLNHSTSGGAFSALSDAILKKGGIVFGAVYDEEFRVIHVGGETENERDRMRGSKYLQSDMNSAYRCIQTALQADRFVLFVGTPCQVAGLRSFLRCDTKEYPKLYTVDFICHGVTSPMLFRDYLKFVEKKFRKKIIAHECRSKKKGWAHVEGNTFADKSEDYDSRFSQLHRRLFHKDVANRPSCYCCKYTSLNRISDITIADFWGVEMYLPEMYNTNGVSALLVNSPKGAALFDEVKESGTYRETTSDCIAKRQPHLSKPTECPKNRNQFWTTYFSQGYYKAIKTVFYRPIHEAMVDYMKRIGVFGFVKKIMGRQ